MSFGKMFDGYCVVHAEHCTSDRREWFEHELKRVGIEDYTIVEAPKIEDDDLGLSRLKGKHRIRRAKSRFSHFKATIKCIDIARDKKWRNVVIIEDDIIFRKQFSARWAEVEDEVSDYNWDVLFLSRRIGLQIELDAPTRLIRIRNTPRTNCFVIREAFFSVYQDARSVNVTGSSDSLNIFRHLGNNDCRILSTSRNLSGEKGGFKSCITGRSHADTLRDCFGIQEFKEENG